MKKLRHIKLFNESIYDEYNYENAKNNPETIVVKFAPGGENKFWDQYIKSTDSSYYRGLGENWYYFPGWSGLTDNGLEMRDGVYYSLYKLYEPESLKKWMEGGRKGEAPQETFFLKYNKEAGEISIWSSSDYSLDDRIFTDREFTELKPNSRYTYCRLKGPNGESRVATIGSKDHIGYFEVIGIK